MLKEARETYKKKRPKRMSREMDLKRQKNKLKMNQRHQQHQKPNPAVKWNEDVLTIQVAKNALK